MQNLIGIHLATGYGGEGQGRNKSRTQNYDIVPLLGDGGPTKQNSRPCGYSLFRSYNFKFVFLDVWASPEPTPEPTLEQIT